MSKRDGIIIIDKEPGLSSFKVAQKVGNIIKAKKCGHAGTLDPFATGVMVILLGRGTKLSPFLISHDKAYQAGIRLGIETDTQDFTGRIVNRNSIGNISGKDIQEEASGFLGEISQIPPLYSAVHCGGKRAYELARAGERFDIKERKVKIYYINILSLEFPDLFMEVGCSSGTYLRAFASALGRNLGTGAHLISLKRIRSGPFQIDNTLNLKQVERYTSNGTIDRHIISMADALGDMKEIQVPAVLARKIRNGYRPGDRELPSSSGGENTLPGGYVKVVQGKELVAVLKRINSGYDLARVFND